MFKKVRWALAHFIAPDYYDDLEERFSEFLCFATGGMLSKTNYSLRTMIDAVRDYDERICGECEFKKGGD
jgi:hypothetical protein